MKLLLSFEFWRGFGSVLHLFPVTDFSDLQPSGSVSEELYSFWDEVGDYLTVAAEEQKMLESEVEICHLQDVNESQQTNPDAS